MATQAGSGGFTKFNAATEIQHIIQQLPGLPVDANMLGMKAPIQRATSAT